MKTMGKFYALAAFLFAATLASGAPGLAVKASLPITDYVKNEPVVISVSIENTGVFAYIIDDYAPYDQNKIELFVRDSRGIAMLPESEEPVISELVLKPGETKELKITASDFYDLTTEGNYRISLVVSRGDESVAAQVMPFTVVSGINLKAVRRATADGGELEYQLSYWTRKDKEYLFLRIKNPASGEVRGFATLGPVVRVIEPQIRFENDTIYVTHQTERHKFTRSKLVPKGTDLQIVGTEPIISQSAILEAKANAAAMEKIAEFQANPPKDTKKPFVTPPKPSPTDNKPLGPVKK